jgi:hypothetical protein
MVKRRVIRLSVLLGVAVVAVLPLGLCAGPPGYYVEKYGHVEGLARPTATARAIEPEEQTEAHTCGMHAIRSVYRAYGMDPDAAGLRFRLGTDKALTNVTPKLTGTIHPDILRVLGQDGFDAETLMMGEKGPARLRAHLETGHSALGLVEVGEVLHWLVLAGVEGEEVVIVDSLSPEAYRRGFDAYARDEVLNAILIEPSQ